MAGSRSSRWRSAAAPQVAGFRGRLRSCARRGNIADFDFDIADFDIAEAAEVSPPPTRASVSAEVAAVRPAW
ncbi:hypothetical protein [Parafrankia sp. EUN1f]|uniref:hypothetical protein n=1 Tax=Parafrankia sp. EUN1f TaxID=102897 RepID=UPI0002E732D0|nr:hypothetical protein [Parafrankia sp. EUN1f]